MCSIGSAVWLLHLFQTRFDRASGLRLRLGRAAFKAQVLQAPVVVGDKVTIVTRLALTLARLGDDANLHSPD